MNKYVLPPLPKHKAPPHGLEQRLNDFVARANAEPSWPRALAVWFIRRIAHLTLRFGRGFPYVFYPWIGISIGASWVIDQWVRRETGRTIFLRRLFSLRKTEDNRFRLSYMAVNWIVFLFLLTLMDNATEGIYAYATYPFGTYRDVVVTQAYRNITEHNTYSIHGYQIGENGEQIERYFEIAPNLWFWEFYPEFTFGQVPVLGLCTFDTYGWSIRWPRRLRLFSPGSLYALNPYIVNMHCRPPTIVPDSH